MKKVTDQYQIEYVLDTKSKQGMPDGDVYRISGENGLCVKILKNPSKTMQLDLENAMQSGISMGISEIPMEIAYSKGRFVGYIFQSEEKPEILPYPKEEAKPVPYKSRPDISILDNMGFKVLAAAVIGLLLTLLNMKVFYWQYLQFVTSGFSSDTLSGCMLLGCSGVTSTIGGVVAMILLGMAIKDSNGLLFIPLEAIAFFAGILVVDFIVVFLVALVLGAVSLIVAIMPAVIVIAAVIWVIKRIF